MEATEEILDSAVIENAEEPLPEVKDEMHTEDAEEKASFDLGSDLDELASEFPRAATEDPDAIIDTARYEELRALGLSPREAFLATSKKGEAHAADTRAHLGGSVPKRARPLATGMSAHELKCAKEIFGDMSDEELRSLYRRVTK